MVGSAILKLLVNLGRQVFLATRDQLDLTNQAQVLEFFEKNKFDQVYLAAAKVGGIFANNTYPADFIYDNLMIQSNVIHAAHKNDIQKLLFLGASGIYPKIAPQPSRENSLLTGYLEETNEPYAVAKIAGIKMCESFNRQFGRNYRSIMPTNLYGENDNFHDMNSHVIPALIKRFHFAKTNGDKEVVVWGTGAPMREFMYVEDMASASVFVMDLPADKYSERVNPMCSHLNIGTGSDCSIKNLTEMIASVVNFKGEIFWDRSKLDGAPRKLLDSSNLRDLGWGPKTNLEAGLRNTYSWFLENQSRFRQK
jgi:GDP-L-fucose synthase